MASVQSGRRSRQIVTVARVQRARNVHLRVLAFAPPRVVELVATIDDDESGIVDVRGQHVGRYQRLEGHPRTIPSTFARQPSLHGLRLTTVRMLLALLLSAATSSATAGAIAAAVARVDAVPVPSTSTAVRVSGELSDQIWQTATAVDQFVQRQPEEGGRPSQRTEFRVAFDSTTLFVKVHAFDTEPARIVSYLTRRD